MLSGHSAAQEIKHLWKFTSGLSLSEATKQACSALQNFSWRPCTAQCNTTMYIIIFHNGQPVHFDEHLTQHLNKTFT
jgi:hypothetical protein